MAICDKCKKEIIQESCFTGYGVNSAGEKLCYACCGELDTQELASLKLGEKMTLYLVNNNDEARHNVGASHIEAWVTNFPNTLNIPIYTLHKRKHNFAGVQNYVYFKFKGNFYMGRQVGNNNELCRITRIKQWSK